MTTVLSCRCMPVSSLVELVLLRHGIAEARLNGLDHPERALTTLGRQRTRLMMETLVGRGLEVDRLITSPFRRAMDGQTVGRRPCLFRGHDGVGRLQCHGNPQREKAREARSLPAPRG